MEKDSSIFKFLLSEKFITLTSLGSIFTFAFISSFKGDIIDPVIDFILPTQNFDFMNVTIREGEKVVFPERQIEVRVGRFFVAFITWLLLMFILYGLWKFTSFPDTSLGNITGSAIM